jgi:hypothetical protein
VLIAQPLTFANWRTVKNRETHCAGLSLALFFFAIIGNVTYVASILAKSLAKRHLIANASWLAGSGGVIALDIVVSLNASLRFGHSHLHLGSRTIYLLRGCPPRGCKKGSSSSQCWCNHRLNLLASTPRYFINHKHHMGHLFTYLTHHHHIYLGTTTRPQWNHAVVEPIPCCINTKLHPSLNSHTYQRCPCFYSL